MEGLRVTRASLRIMALMARSLEVRPERLRAGFTPGVFATDRALELVAAGMPFRDAYQHVRSHLDELESADPDAALRAKTHAGGTAGLDFAMYRARVGDVKRWVRGRRRRSNAAFSKLLGVAFPLS